MPVGNNYVQRVSLGWAGPCYPYIKNAQVFQCPSDTTASAGGVPYVSYALNGNLLPGMYVTSFVTPQLQGVTTVNFTQVTNSVLMFEVQGANVDVTNVAETTSPAGNGANGSSMPAGITYATGYMDNLNFVTSAYPYWYNNNPLGRHFDGANFLAIDGHVKWLMPSRVSVGNNSNNGIFACGGNTMSPQTAYGETCAEGAALGLHEMTFSTD